MSIAIAFFMFEIIVCAYFHLFYANLFADTITGK